MNDTGVVEVVNYCSRFLNYTIIESVCVCFFLIHEIEELTVCMTDVLKCCGKSSDPANS